MKKLLGISLVAALAVSPMMAMADPATGTTGANAPITTENAPTYKGADAHADTDGNLATAGYVKGAYNDAIKAINKVHTTAQAGINAINDRIGDTTSLGENGTLMGAISAAQTAATTAAGVYDNADSGLQAETVQDAIDEVEGRVDGLETKVGNATLTTTAGTVTAAINELDTAVGNLDTAVDANTDAITVLNGDASTTGSVAKAVADAMTTVQGDFATKAGVLATINASTVNVMTTWGNTTPTQVAITAPGTYQTGAVNNNNNEEPEEEPEEP